MMPNENQNQFLERVVETVQVSPQKYDEANQSFHSICNWFTRENSTIKNSHLESYLQGSFRLGTAIRPTTDEGEYDLDIVVLIEDSKATVSQAKLKERVGVEIKSYAKAHGMTRPVNARRCWTQNYADDRRFHVDSLPAIPDEVGLREKLEARELTSVFLNTAIAITDKTDANFEHIHPVWQNSNPKGYATWFEERMSDVLMASKEAIALRESKAVDDIPTFRVQTPLQKSVQLLKYHRDVMFADDLDDKPISIIITTLAAHAYRGQTDLNSALEMILRDMDLYIETKQGVDWVANPTNELENFADKWVEHPQRKENFHNWLAAARRDLGALSRASQNDRPTLLTEAFGDEFASKLAGSRSGLTKAPKRTSIFARHRQRPPWTFTDVGTVKILRATKSRNGFRTVPFSSDSQAVAKGTSLQFYAKTDVRRPYKVYWQVVNTGDEATNASCLRGGFDLGSVTSGALSRREGTKYSGTHTIECFIVKDEMLVARSGQFIVKIQ